MRSAGCGVSSSCQFLMLKVLPKVAKAAITSTAENSGGKILRVVTFLI